MSQNPSNCAKLMFFFGFYTPKPYFSLIYILLEHLITSIPQIRARQNFFSRSTLKRRACIPLKIQEHAGPIVFFSNANLGYSIPENNSLPALHQT